MKQTKIKIGDTVMAIEGAWSRRLDGTDVNMTPHRIDTKNPDGSSIKFKVLATRCRIPVDPGRYANTIIQTLNSDVVFTINDCNLFKEPDVSVRFMSNGIDVTDSISYQSKLTILKANIMEK